MLLGFSSGLPLALSGETLRVWMSDSGVDLGTIGLLSLAGLPYTLKFIWAPVVDAWQVPGLSRRFGRRRAWLIASQLVLMAAIVFLGTRDPINAPWMIGLGGAHRRLRLGDAGHRRRRLPRAEPAGGRAGRGHGQIRRRLPYRHVGIGRRRHRLQRLAGIAGPQPAGGVADRLCRRRAARAGRPVRRGRGARTAIRPCARSRRAAVRCCASTRPPRAPSPISSPATRLSPFSPSSSCSSCAMRWQAL